MEVPDRAPGVEENFAVLGKALGLLASMLLIGSCTVRNLCQLSTGQDVSLEISKMQIMAYVLSVFLTYAHQTEIGSQYGEYLYSYSSRSKLVSDGPGDGLHSHQPRSPDLSKSTNTKTQIVTVTIIQKQFP